MKTHLLAVTACLSFISTAYAGPFTSNVNNDVYSGVVNGIPTARDYNDGVPDLFDAVNNVLGTNYSHNYQLDDRFVAQDEYFTSNGMGVMSLIGLTAGNNNTLGIYQGAEKTEILPYHSHFGFTGDGSSANPYSGASYNIEGDFSWYLQANGPWDYNTFYSESALNAGGWDHMMTFAMPELNGQSRFMDINGQVVEHIFNNAYLIGWEDLPYEYQSPGILGDDDYDDMMYLIDFSLSDPAEPVSEPFTALLFGCSLLSLAGLRRKKR